MKRVIHAFFVCSSYSRGLVPNRLQRFNQCRKSITKPFPTLHNQIGLMFGRSRHCRDLILLQVSSTIAVESNLLSHLHKFPCWFSKNGTDLGREYGKGDPISLELRRDGSQSCSRLCKRGMSHETSMHLIYPM